MKTTDLSSLDPELLKAEEKIIRAALTVFSTHPLDVVSLRKIAREANVSVSLITYHFKSKENLYGILLTRVSEHLASYLDPYADILDGRRALTPDEAAGLLRELVSGYADRFFSGPRFDSYILIIMKEHSSPSPFYDILYDNLFKKIFDLLVTLIVVATGRGNFRRASFQAVTILGQLLGFRYERQLLMRGLGMTCYSKEETEEIKNEILRNVFLQLEIRQTDPLPE